MTIYHRLKVLLIKGYRMVRYGFKQVRPRSHMMIFLERIQDDCDYCNDKAVPIVVLEADYEVYPKICANCLDRAFRVLFPLDGFMPRQQQILTKDHRGVIQ